MGRNVLQWVQIGPNWSKRFQSGHNYLEWAKMGGGGIIKTGQMFQTEPKWDNIGKQLST